MSFFEDPPASRTRSSPPWSGPPEMVLGASVSAKRILYRTDSVVVALTDVMAYPAGCQFGLHLAIRRAGMAIEEWRDVAERFFEDPFRDSARASNALRVGVQFTDGTKATTVDPQTWLETPPPSAPAPPVFHEAGGGGASSSDDEVHCAPAFWLWPLPPPEPFTFAIEWPMANVPLTTTEIDGAAIVAASDTAEDFWP